jgi:hypothetical protein
MSEAAALVIKKSLASVLHGTKRTSSAFGSLRRGESRQQMLETMSDPKDAARLDAAIDENLRKIYHEILEEDIPDRFKQLLEQLRKKEAGE